MAENEKGPGFPPALKWFWCPWGSRAPERKSGLMVGLGAVAADVVQLFLGQMAQMFSGAAAQAPFGDQHGKRHSPLRQNW